MKIHFNFEVNSLYDLAYISVDLYQLIVFCELLEDEHDGLKVFLESPGSINRYNKELRKYREKIRVVHLQDGSIEIFIDGLKELTKIVISFLATYIMNENRTSKEKIRFEIEAEDKYLNELFDELKNGYYGLKEEDWFEWLHDLLIKKGYSVEIINEDCYRVIKKYGKRMLKTVPKKIKPKREG